MVDEWSYIEGQPLLEYTPVETGMPTGSELGRPSDRGESNEKGIKMWSGTTTCLLAVVLVSSEFRSFTEDDTVYPRCPGQEANRIVSATASIKGTDMIPGDFFSGCYD